MRFPLAVIDSIQKKCGRGFPVLVRYSFEEWCAGGRGLEEGIETARVLERAGVAARRPLAGHAGEPGRRLRPDAVPAGLGDLRRRGDQEGRAGSRSSRATRCATPSTASRSWPRARPTSSASPASSSPTRTGRSRRSTARSSRSAAASRCLGGCWQESLMAKHEIACSINAACGNPAYDAHEARPTQPVRVAVVGGGPAGMEAARIATERGHLVTLFEKSRRARRRDEVRLPGAGQGEDALVPGLDPGPAPRPRTSTSGSTTRRRSTSCAASTSSSTRRAPRRTCPPVAGDASRVVPFEEAMACPKVACECHPGGRKMRKLGARVLLWGDCYAATDTAAWLADIGQAGHDRDREPRVRRGLRGHPHVRPAQAVRAGRRRGPPLAAVPVPGHGHHEHDRRRDPRRRRSSSRTRTSTRTDARGRRRRHLPHAARTSRCSTELRAAGVHVLNVGDSVAPAQPLPRRSRKGRPSASRSTSTCCSTRTARSSTTSRSTSSPS